MPLEGGYFQFALAFETHRTAKFLPELIKHPLKPGRVVFPLKNHFFFGQYRWRFSLDGTRFVQRNRSRRFSTCFLALGCFLGLAFLLLFIFAIIVEEYGLAGGAFVLFLYLWLLYRGIRWAARADRAYGALLSAGLSFSLVLQALVHMAVSVQLIPVTGQTLPLVSWGGSSLLFTGVSIGVILSVSRAYSTETTPPPARVREPVAA